MVNEKIENICFRNSYLVTLLLAVDNVLLSLTFNLVCNLEVGPKSDKLTNLF